MDITSPSCENPCWERVRRRIKGNFFDGDNDNHTCCWMHFVFARFLQKGFQGKILKNWTLNVLMSPNLKFYLIIAWGWTKNQSTREQEVLIMSFKCCDKKRLTIFFKNKQVLKKSMLDSCFGNVIHKNKTLMELKTTFHGSTLLYNCHWNS